MFIDIKLFSTMWQVMTEFPGTQTVFRSMEDLNRLFKTVWSHELNVGYCDCKKIQGAIRRNLSLKLSYDNSDVLIVELIDTLPERFKWQQLGLTE